MSAVTALWRNSAIAELMDERTYRRLLLSLSITAAAVGMIPSARIILATDAVKGAAGFGVLASIGAATVGVCGLPSGLLVDRFGPRWVLLGAGWTNGALLLVLAARLSRGSLTPPELLVTAFLDGALFAAILASEPVAQAATVPQESRGTAEFVTLLRLSIGALIGAWAASQFTTAQAILVIAGSLILVSNTLVWASLRRTDLPPRSRGVGLVDSVRQAVQAVISRPQLRSAVSIELVMRFLVPTQLVSLFLAEVERPDLFGTMLASGIIGVLAAHLLLALGGLPRRPRAALVRCFAAYTAMLAVYSILVWTEFVDDHPWSVYGGVLAGSLTVAYGQGLLLAIVQQRTPDEVRGRVAGALWSLRMAMVAGGVALAAIVITRWDTAVFLAVMSTAFGLALVLLRGFRSVAATSAELRDVS